MRVLVGAGVAAAVWLAATPGFAGVGQCIWQHLPQAERDRAIAPGSVSLTFQQTMAGLDSAIPIADELAAMRNCGVAEKDRNGAAASDAFSGYVGQHWAEHWLFLYDIHHPSQQKLDSAWGAVDPAVAARIAAGVHARSDIKADAATALAAFERALAFPDAPSADTETNLRLYIISRADSETAEAILK